MNPKPLIPREQAMRDVGAAIDYYATEASELVALRFVDALHQAYDAIARTPQAGSPRYGLDLDLPNLRSKALRRYPYRVFYVEENDHIDVWRVLHAVRDIPASFTAPED